MDSQGNARAHEPFEVDRFVHASSLLHVFLETTSDVVFFKDRESRYLAASTVLAAAFGLETASELVGKTDFDFFPRAFARRMFADEQAIVRTGQPIVRAAEQVPLPGGNVVWTETSKLPLLDESGEIVGTFGISRNVTERKRAETALREQTERLLRIIETQRDLAAANHDLESVLELACERLQELSRAEGASVLTLDGRELVYRSAAGFVAGNVGVRVPLEGTVAGWAFRHNRSTITGDTSADPRIGDIARQHGISSLVAVPLQRGGVPVGSVQVLSPRVDAFDEDTLQTVELVSVALSAALSHAAEFDAKRAEVAALDQFRTIFEAAPIGIVRTDASGRAVTANPAIERMLGYSASELAEHGFTEYVGSDHATRSAAILGESVERAFDPWSADTRRVEKRFGRKDGAAVWAQVTAKLTRNPDGTPAYGLAMIEDISARKEAEEALRREAERNAYQALHDPLTGLANRALFRDRIQQGISRARRRKDGTVAVLIMDIDSFKEINDSLGHHAGDDLLVELGGRLETCLRASDTVARLGGDEFGIVLPEACSPAELDALIQRIVAAVGQPFNLEGIAVAVEASIGVARFPTDGNDVVALVRNADIAMYAAKRAGSSHAFYDADGNVRGPSQFALLDELRRAIGERQPALSFRPRASLATGDVRTVEALLHWTHPTRGLVASDDFMSLVQESSLLTTLTLYVVEEALRHCRGWHVELGPTVSVSVGISARNLLSSSFPEQVTRILERSGVDPSHLVLEIEEATTQVDPEAVERALAQLSALGIRLGIAGFGTGHSSLAGLRRLPIGTVKLAPAALGDLATDDRDAAVVRSLIDLAKSLGLDVIADEVETKEDWDRLAAFGCASAQGSVLSVPLCSEDLVRWLRERSIVTEAA